MQNSYLPEIASEVKASAKPLVDPRPLAVLTHSPSRWQVLGERVVPMLGELRLVAGTMGVQRTRAGAWALHDARAELDRLGRVIVPMDALPPEEVAGGRTSIYYQPEGRPDLKLHYCERTTPGSRETRCDEPRWQRYLSWLVDSGTIAPPTIEQMELLAERVDERYTDAVDKAQKVPSFRARAEMYARQAAVIKAEIEKAKAKVGDAKEAAPAQPEEDATASLFATAKARR